MDCVSPELDANLKCIVCKNYISVEPVVVDHRGRYICGRSECVPYHQRSNRDLTYETLAFLIRLPCKNKAFGCTKKLRISPEAEGHEVRCEFRRVRCTLWPCKEELSVKNWRALIVSHYLADHGIPFHPNKPLSISHNEDKTRKIMVESDGHFFLLNIIQDKAQQCCSIQPNLVLRPKTAKADRTIPDKLQYKIKAFQRNIRQTNYIELCGEIRSGVGEWHTFECAVFINTLSAEICFEFHLVADPAAQEEPSKLTFEGLREHLECPVCKETMIGHIYLCKRGHSLCGACKGQLARCPMCTASYEGARNFALENLATTLKSSGEARPNR